MLTQAGHRQEFIDSELETLLQRFNREFSTISAATPELIQRAQQIRYQVYCVENAFEDPRQHPDGRERDQFDDHSVHSLLLHRGEAIGTVRLVLPRAQTQSESFPLQRLVAPQTNGLPFPLRSSAEVSRFSISRDYVRGVRSGCSSPETEDRFDPRCAPLMRLGLIQALVRMSEEHGITHWCAVMEPKLLRMLAAMAIRFEPLGPLVDYHGLRQPCYCNVGSILAAVKRERPAFWEVLTDGGAIGGALRVAA